MGFCQHRNVHPLLCLGIEVGNDFLNQRNHLIVQGIFHEHRHRSVVDVLRGKAEMNEFLVFCKAKAIKTFLQEVLHSLHVVVGYAFYLLDMRGLGHTEVAIYVAHWLEHRMVDIAQLRQRNLGEGNEIFHLYLNAISD